MHRLALVGLIIASFAGGVAVGLTTLHLPSPTFRNRDRKISLIDKEH